MTQKKVERDAVRLSLRLLQPDDWPVVTRLFGTNGACGGCWCMWWRVPRGGKLWEERKGEKNQRAMKRLVESGKAHAALAFDGDEPVGWCCFGPRADFPRAERVKACRREWSQGTWAAVCFYVRAAWRRCGVSSRLLERATQEAFCQGATEVEGYPAVPTASGDLPAAFAWTGVPALFEEAGYQELPGQEGSRRLYLRRRSEKIS